MELQLSSIHSQRISALARQTGFSPLVLIHQAIDEFLERNENSERLELRAMACIGDYEPQ